MSKHPIIANRTAFLVIGCLEAAWAPLVPYVKRAFSLDEASLGLLMLCTGLGSIIALPLSSWLCVRFGAKRVVYFSGFLMAFSLLTISLLLICRMKQMYCAMTGAMDKKGCSSITGD